MVRRNERGCSQILLILGALFFAVIMLVLMILGDTSALVLAIVLVTTALAIVGTLIIFGWNLVIFPLSFYLVLFAVMIYYGGVIDPAIDFNSPDMFRIVLALSGALLVPIVGGLYANLIFRFQPAREIKEYLEAPIVEKRPRRHFALWVALLAIASIFAGLVYYGGEIPLASSVSALISGQDIADARAEMSQTRREITKGFDFGLSEYSGKGISIQFIQGVLPFLSYLMLISTRIFKGRGWQLLTIAIIFVTIVFLIGAGKRSPVLLFGVGLFTTEILRSPGRGLMKFNRNLIVWPMLILIPFITISILLPRYSIQEGASSLIQSIVYRVTQGQAHNAVFIMQTIPENLDYFGGRVLQSDIVDLIPAQRGEINLANLVAQLQLRRTDTTTYASSSGFSALYADYGVPGALLGMFVVGFVLQAVTIIMIRKPKDLTNVATMIYLVVITAPIATSTVLAPVAMLPSFAFIWLIRNNRPKPRQEVIPGSPQRLKMG